MQGLKVFLAIGAFVLAAGCSRQPGGNVDDAIGLGEPTPAVADPTTARQSAAVSTTVHPTEVVAGNGELSRVIESCNVEQVNGQPFGSTPSQVSKSKPVAITGWGVDKEAGSTDVDAKLWLINAADAVTHEVATVSALREDVATSFGLDPAVTKAGFSVTFDAGRLVPGDYKLLLILRSPKGAASCDNGRVITVTD